MNDKSTENKFSNKPENLNDNANNNIENTNNEKNINNQDNTSTEPLVSKCPISNNSISNHNQNIKFPSSELLLTALQIEYDKEDERAKNLDTRVYIFFTLAAALLAFIAQILKIKNIINIGVDNVRESIPYVFYLELAILAPLLLMIAIILFVRVVSTRTYKRINLDSFENEANNKCQKDVVAFGLIEIYKKTINHNIGVNDKKIKLYKWGVYLITISIILIVITYIISINM